MQDTLNHIAWSDEMLLGFTPMDATHKEFVESVASLQQAQGSEVLPALERLKQHIQCHFDEENRWMEETNFPAAECHINEHEDVLKSVNAVYEEATRGRFANAMRLAKELEKWFPGHANYLDSALAHWMCNRSMGGKPVVLRRNLNRL